MKRFTQKFFLLTVGMILSVGASAQDEITHRFPPVTYKQSATGADYVIPAWDIRKVDSNDGYMRFQKKADGKGMIVAALGILEDNSNYNAQFPDQVYINGTQYNTKGLRYGDIFTNMGTGASDDGRFYIFQDETNTLMHQITGTYTVPTSITWKGETEPSDVDEIGPFAYANASCNPNYSKAKRYNRVAAEKIIIPSAITKIGVNAFCQDGTVTEFEFEDTEENPCQITAIPAKAFMNCINIGGIELPIKLPSTISYVGGCAFGGCTNLHKIIFASDECPEFDYLGGRDIFTTSSTSLTDYLQNPKPENLIIEVPLGSANSYMESNNGFLAEKKIALCSKFPIETTSGFMTYCSEADFTFMKYDTSNHEWQEGDVKVYYIKEQDVEVENGKVMLTEVPDDVMVPGWSKTGEGDDAIIEDFGVVLKGTANETYNIFYPNGRVITTKFEDESNCLHGCITATNVNAGSDANNSYFIMSGGVFKRITKNGQCKANRAYIKIAGGPDTGGPETESKDLALSFPDESTGITAHEVQSAQNDAWYTLQGIQVQQPSKGIFIKNGKKFVIK